MYYVGCCGKGYRCCKNYLLLCCHIKPHKILLFNYSFSSSFNNLLFWPQAWYRRGKANASLGNYKNAICDLNVAKSVEPSMGGKRQIEGELKILLDQCKSTTAVEQIQHTENNCNTVGKN